MDTLANNGVLYQGLHILGSGATLTRTAGLTIHPAHLPPISPCSAKDMKILVPPRLRG